MRYINRHSFGIPQRFFLFVHARYYAPDPHMSSTFGLKTILAAHARAKLIKTGMFVTCMILSANITRRIRVTELVLQRACIKQAVRNCNKSEVIGVLKFAVGVYVKQQCQSIKDTRASE